MPGWARCRRGTAAPVYVAPIRANPRAPISSLHTSPWHVFVGIPSARIVALGWEESRDPWAARWPAIDAHGARRSGTARIQLDHPQPPPAQLGMFEPYCSLQWKHYLFMDLSCAEAGIPTPDALRGRWLPAGARGLHQTILCTNAGPRHQEQPRVFQHHLATQLFPQRLGLIKLIILGIICLATGRGSWQGFGAEQMHENARLGNTLFPHPRTCMGRQRHLPPRRMHRQRTWQPCRQNRTA